jgi:DNA polymerase-1
LQKLKSTYVDALPELVSPVTGRVHTSYNQAVAATGRLSSTDPNLQNIPIKTEEGSQIRRAFIPADNKHKILTADYSQIELRVLAHFADETALVESFNKGEDIHARTASEVYGVALADVTPPMRRMAKTANFAVIYGVTAFGLSQQSDMSVPEAKEFIDVYFTRYPMIRKFIDATIASARRDGYVTTLFGRRRYFPEIHSKNASLRQFAERTAVNTVIQGTAAEMIKVAMIEIHKDLENMKSLMIMQVHDELVFDAVESELPELRKLVRDRMENCVRLKVPVTVDMGTGDNWLECK